MGLSFTKRIEILEIAENSGPIPGNTETLFSKAWADIKTIKAGEFAEFATVNYEHTIRFIIRYKKGVKSHMKIRYKDQVYNIESVVNDDEQNRTLTIIASAVS